MSSQEALELEDIEQLQPSSKYLCFKIRDELYGFEITSVREIIRELSVTRVPNTEQWLTGVSNLRGRVTTIINMHQRIGCDGSPDASKWVIVLELDTQNGAATVGAVVDCLPEVITLTSNKLQSRKQSTEQSNYVVALGKTDDRVILILDPNRLVFENL